MLLRFNRLPEDGIAAAVLLLHRTSSIIEIVEHLRFHRRDVGNHGFGFGIHLQDRSAARAGQVEVVLLFGHGMNDSAKQELGAAG